MAFAVRITEVLEKMPHDQGVEIIDINDVTFVLCSPYFLYVVNLSVIKILFIKLRR
jgi:hypothetical protein